MEIKWLNHPCNPELNGEKEHVARSIAEQAIYFKQAELVPFPRRGEKGWLEALARQAAAVTKPGVHDTVAGVVGTEWGIKELSSGKVNVVKKVGSDTYFYDCPPADCPASTRQQYLDAAAVNPEANRGAIEVARQQQINREREEKTASRVAVMSAMFGSKPL